MGVFSLADRVTGTYLFETTAPARRLYLLEAAVQASAGRTDEQPRYELWLHAQSDVLATVQTELLLVDDADGTLLRDASLIPSENKL